MAQFQNKQTIIAISYGTDLTFQKVVLFSLDVDVLLRYIITAVLIGTNLTCQALFYGDRQSKKTTTENQFSISTSKMKEHN